MDKFPLFYNFRKEGSFVSDGRVAGSLAVSRAFGDFYLKNAGLICVPAVRRVELR